MKWVWPAVLRSHFFCLLRAVSWVVISRLAWISNSSAAPRIQFDHQFWNFGIVTNIPSIAHDYWVSNSGDAPLVINSIDSTCPACLHASIGKTNLPPGAATVVHARLDLRLLSGPTSRAILITCNDPQNPTPVLELNGEGVPLYQLDPVTPLLDLAEGPGKVTIGINPLLHLHAPLSQVVYDNTNVLVNLASAAGGGWFLTVQADSSFPKSNATVTVVIRSSDTNDPPCSVDVFIRNAPVLELLPTQLAFQAQTNEQTRVLWLKQHGPSPLALLDAVLPQDKFHCEIDPDPDGRDYTIYVTTWQQQSASGQTNELVLRMMDVSNREQDINVPVFVSKP
jgi:hypothetical protein